MTQKDKKKIADEQSLEETLQKIQNKKNEEETKANKDEAKTTEENILILQKQKDEALDIAKKIQFDYINLKTDFERLQRLGAEKEKSAEIDALIKHTKKLFPIINQLKTSLDHTDKQEQKDPFVEGIKMIYENLIKTLAERKIYPIASLGCVPDSNLHEPISTLPIEDAKQKGTIIQVFEQGYYLDIGGEKKVITASKVIIGA